MPVPKHRRSKSKKRARHAAWKVVMPELRPCSNCGVLSYSHRACTICGYYNGKPVLSVASVTTEDASKDA
jgi:large subunit ribosomal protein L32